MASRLNLRSTSSRDTSSGSCMPRPRRRGLICKRNNELTRRGMTRRHWIRHASIKAPHSTNRKNVNKRNRLFPGASRRRRAVSHDDERKSREATARPSRKYCSPTKRCRVVRWSLPREEIPSRNGADLRRISRNGNLKNIRRRDERRRRLKIEARYRDIRRRSPFPVPPHRDAGYTMRTRSHKRNPSRVEKPTSE